MQYILGVEKWRSREALSKPIELYLGHALGSQPPALSSVRVCFNCQTSHAPPRRPLHLVTEPGGGVEAQPPQPDKGQHGWAMVPSDAPYRLAEAWSES